VKLVRALYAIPLGALPLSTMLFVTMLSAEVVNAAIATSVEPRLVEEMDTVRLTLRADGQANAEALDLTALEADFEVVGSNTQSQYRSVNGRVESWVEYQISLRPRRTGELVVPSIAIGSDRSKAVQVVVRAMDPGVKQTIERMVFFESELSENPVYVQAETILKRRLYYSNGVQIYSDLPGVPEIPNAVVIPLGDTQSRSTNLNGQRYGVIEQQFAIFPEQSGALVIPEISITSSVRLQSGGRTRRSGIRISTEAVRIEVLPVPEQYPRDQPWLPATDVRIAQAWAPARSSFAVGDPLQRRIAVTAVGNTGSAIPPLRIQFSEAHFKWYPEAPTLNDDAKGQQIIGTRIEDYSLIALQPGPAPLAEIAVAWWDTVTEQVRYAKLPRSMLAITGSSVPRAPPSTEPQATPEADAAAAQPAEAETAVSAGPVLWFALLGLAALILVAALVLARTRRKSGSARTARPTLEPTPSPGAKAAWSQLKRACRNDDLAGIRAALVAYSNTRSDASEIDAQVWRRLNESVYGQAGSTITGAEVLEAAAQTRRRPPRATSDPLPGLFS
jgi:hypothetical protein